MFRHGRIWAAIAVVGSLVMASAALAAGAVGYYGKPGTKAPPPTLKGFAMKKFGPDTRPNEANVTTVKGPTGEITFSKPVQHDTIGSGWEAWSNGYKGSVYATNESNSISFTLPRGTKAFYFYAEPNSLGTFAMTASADGASSGPKAVHSNLKTGGARYFGFYAKTKTARVTKVKVTITGESGESQGFAIGEFGIH